MGDGPVFNEVHEIAPGVLVAHIRQWQTASTVLVGRRAGRTGEALVVDPAMTAAEIDGLAAAVATRGLVVTGGVVTHAHVDHVLWRPALGGATRWAAPRAHARIREAPEQVLRDDAVAELGIEREVLAGVRPLADDAEVLPWSAREIRVLVHDGHAPGHLGLLVPDAGVLVAGDMLSAREVPLLDTEALDPIADYVLGLERLAGPLESGAVDVVIPGHGPVLSREQALSVLARDRAYLAVLRAGRAPDDDRLADTWVAGEHATQLQALGITG